MDGQVLPVPNDKTSIDFAVTKWLEASFSHSQSLRTIGEYKDTLESFRSYLHLDGLDLLSNPDLVSSHAQTWARIRSDKSRRPGPVSGATYNLRLAAISSFYQYCIQSLRYKGENPISRFKKTKVQKYGKARSLNRGEVIRLLKKIDRSTLEGQRDYVLLQVGLNTGRRAQELASLRWRHVEMEGECVTLTFEECKGHKTMRDTLAASLSKALLRYLRTVYDGLHNMEPESPLWVSFSDRNKGKGIGMQTIADICEARLGVSTVHSMRHTFAHTMQEAGASITDIQSRLGHESLATTGIYLARLKSAYNPYAEKIAGMFGLEE